MTKMNEVYKCEICGNTVEMVNPGMGQMICCGKPMILMVEKEISETGTEKHKPVIEGTDSVEVKIGSIPHPMEDAHYIQWIEIINSYGQITRKFLKPGQAPQVEFCNQDVSIARGYCNIHGLWVTRK